MSSPQRSDRLLEHYDADFYLRKIDRLEQDITAISDELSKARLRLRRAEDFELKYDILVKQKLLLQDDQIKRDRDIYDLQAKNEEMQLTLREKTGKHEDGLQERGALLEEIRIWKERVVETEERLRLITLEEEARARERVEMEVASMKRQFAGMEEDYLFRIALLSKQVEERKSNEGSLVEKQAKQRREKEAEVGRQEKIIQSLRQQLLDALQDKSAEVERVKGKFSKLMGDELQHIQTNVASQDHRFRLELQWLRKAIAMKNEEISLLQTEQKTALDVHAKQRLTLQEEIGLLRAKISEIGCENTQQIHNLKERLTKIHSLDLQTLRRRYEEITDSLKAERSAMEDYVRSTEGKLEEERKEFERGREELRKTIRDNEVMIQTLRLRGNEGEHSSNREMQSLQTSLTKISEERDVLTSEYQGNVCFLNLQITKLINSNELKNKEIRALHEEIAQLKKEQFEGTKELEVKWKGERKDRQQERQKERSMREAQEEDGRAKEQQWRHRERELQRQIQGLRRERLKHEGTIQQLEKEIERVVKEQQVAEDSLRRELSKGQVAAMGAGGLRRELMGENEKQRVELEAIKRLEMDQAQKKNQLEITRLTTLNQQLQTELLTKQIAYSKIQEELKVATHNTKSIDKITRQKALDYQKKMTALNSEILLTQNLYQSFIDAKSRVIRKD